MAQAIQPAITALFEQRVLDIEQRIDALRPKHNPKLRRGVKVGILAQQFDSRKRRTP